MQPDRSVGGVIELLWGLLFGSRPGRAVVAIAVLVVAWHLSRVVVQLLGRPVARQFRRPSVTQTVLRAIRLSLMLFAAAIAGSVVGLGPGDILISVTVISAVVGIILAPVAGSLINGLFVLADQPYEIGDMIELVDTGQRGFVEDITLRYTKIFTDDNTVLVIPNSTIRERDVLNYSAEDERTRLKLDVTVSYEGDLDQARAIMERAARDVEEVVVGGPTIRIGSARYPAGPRCQIRDYADHGVSLRLRYWVKTPYYISRVRSKDRKSVV